MRQGRKGRNGKMCVMRTEKRQKTGRGGGQRVAERGIMRMYEMRVKQRKKEEERKSKRGGGKEASWRKSRWRRSFSVFYFNLYICAISSETNVLCLLIVH